MSSRVVSSTPGSANIASLLIKFRNIRLAKARDISFAETERNEDDGNTVLAFLLEEEEEEEEEEELLLPSLSLDTVRRLEGVLKKNCQQSSHTRTGFFNPKNGKGNVLEQCASQNRPPQPRQ